MKNICIILFVLLTGVTFGQVTVKEDPAITRLMQSYEQSNNEDVVIRGWRIQIMTTNDRSQMEAGLLRFENLYPHINYKWEHNPPYYQVRIGAFEKKNDLESYLLEFKKEFPSSIPVQDDIKKTEILEF